jgi:thiamine kinase-like enzyme
MPALDAALERLVPALGPLEGEPVALDGGITNRNYRVRLGGGDYVVRLCGKDTAVLGIDRDAEARATEVAASLGVGPALVDRLPDALVTRFISGRSVEAEELRARVPEVAATLRAIHDGPPVPGRFDSFRVVEAYREATQARGGSVPDHYAEAAAAAERIEAVMGGRPPVPCHNDLLTANFIDDGERLRIVDWEYAGMGERFFDLANLSINNGFSEEEDRALLDAYFGGAGDAEFASLRLMRVMSDFREAMWGVVQTVASDLDFDYVAYADEHFARLRASAADPRFQDWLEVAAAA